MVEKLSLRLTVAAAAVTLVCLVDNVPDLESPVSILDLALLCAAAADPVVSQNLVYCLALYGAPTSDLQSLELLPSICLSAMDATTDTETDWTSSSTSSSRAGLSSSTSSSAWPSSSTSTSQVSVPTSTETSVSVSSWNESASFSGLTASSSASPSPTAAEQTIIPVALSLNSTS
ncbi:hypothetical protein HK405_008919, partial [Cladochytrium tenue]